MEEFGKSLFSNGSYPSPVRYLFETCNFQMGPVRYLFESCVSLVWNLREILEKQKERISSWIGEYLRNTNGRRGNEQDCCLYAWKIWRNPKFSEIWKWNPKKSFVFFRFLRKDMKKVEYSKSVLRGKVLCIFKTACTGFFFRVETFLRLKCFETTNALGEMQFQQFPG